MRSVCVRSGWDGGAAGPPGGGRLGWEVPVRVPSALSGCANEDTRPDPFDSFYLQDTQQPHGVIRLSQAVTWVKMTLASPRAAESGEEQAQCVLREGPQTSRLAAPGPPMSPGPRAELPQAGCDPDSCLVEEGGRRTWSYPPALLSGTPTPPRTAGLSSGVHPADSALPAPTSLGLRPSSSATGSV